MKNALLALTLAGTLTVPLITPALGSESAAGKDTNRPAASQPAPWSRLPLPLVPYLETMPWLNSDATWKDPQIDSTWRPDLDKLGPLDLQLSAPEGWSKQVGRKPEGSNNG